MALSVQQSQRQLIACALEVSQTRTSLSRAQVQSVNTG